MMSRIVGIGPSIVDLIATLRDDVYLSANAALGVRPGGWRRISMSEAAFLANTVAPQVADGKSWHPERLLELAHIRGRPGSTIINMMMAMPQELRNHCTFVSTAAMNAGQTDALTSFFTASIESAGILHERVAREGDNPVVLVLNSPGSSDRTLAMYPGVAYELDDMAMEQNAHMLLVDAYNLGNHPTGRFIARTIASGRYRVCLSLGNDRILREGLAGQIREYVEGRMITVMCGTSEEFLALYPEVGKRGEHVSLEQRLRLIGENVPYALMTLGSRGMSTAWRRSVHHAKPSLRPGSTVLSTVGAGDAAAGAFCAAIVAGWDGERSLQVALQAAERALHVL